MMAYIYKYIDDQLLRLIGLLTGACADSEMKEVHSAKSLGFQFRCLRAEVVIR